MHSVGVFSAINRLVPAIEPDTDPVFPLIVPINNSDGVMMHTGTDGVVDGVDGVLVDVGVDVEGVDD